MLSLDENRNLNKILLKEYITNRLVKFTLIN